MSRLMHARDFLMLRARNGGDEDNDNKRDNPLIFLHLHALRASSICFIYYLTTCVLSMRKKTHMSRKKNVSKGLQKIFISGNLSKQQGNHSRVQVPSSLKRFPLEEKRDRTVFSYFYYDIAIWLKKQYSHFYVSRENMRDEQTKVSIDLTFLDEFWGKIPF